MFTLYSSIHRSTSRCTNRCNRMIFNHELSVTILAVNFFVVLQHLVKVCDNFLVQTSIELI